MKYLKYPTKLRKLQLLVIDFGCFHQRIVCTLVRSTITPLEITCPRILFPL